MRRDRLLLAAILLCCAGPPAPAADEHARRPNVLLLIADDQRPDTVHALGNELIRTPHLDRLARRGTAFTRAVCANPICTPSRAEILTGCSGFTNGVLDFGGPIDPGLTTWPQAMKEAGYHTWYVGKWHNNGRPTDHGYEETLGLFSGGGGRWERERVDFKGSPITGYRGWVFQSADGGEKFPDRGVGLTGDISERFADAAIEFLGRETERPFFLHVNFTAPHDPLIMPPGYEDAYDGESLPLPENYYSQHPFDHGNLLGRDEQLWEFPRRERVVRETIAMYYRVISHLDEQVGRILAALDDRGRAERTIVIYTSDHGLAVGSHGLRGKQSMYEHTVNVPLLIAGPGLPSGRTTAAQVYLRELYPTVCELAGIEIPATVHGKSFAAVVKGEREQHHEQVFCYFRDKQRMIRGGRHKLIFYPHLKRYQLFDLAADPLELRDLAGEAEQAETFDDLRRRLDDWRRDVGDKTLAAGAGGGK